VSPPNPSELPCFPQRHPFGNARWPFFLDWTGRLSPASQLIDDVRILLKDQVTVQRLIGDENMQ
jgi:hypothetical protein